MHVHMHVPCTCRACAVHVPVHVRQARACEAHFSGRLLFSEVASHNAPDEYELRLTFDTEPVPGSEAAATLVNLFGPLRPAAARAAEGKLTRQLWAQVDSFREEFMRL